MTQIVYIKWQMSVVYIGEYILERLVFKNLILINALWFYVS